MTAVLVHGWLLAATRDGLVAVGPERVVAVTLDGNPGDRGRLVSALAGGGPADEPAAALGLSADELAELRRALRDAGVLAAEPGPAGAVPADAVPLADALGTPDGAVPPACFTAEELLLVPAGADPALARRALHAFAGGVLPAARADAYAELVAQGGGLAGDRPARDLEGPGLGLDPACFHVVTADGATASISSEALAGLGAERPHRLGVLQEVAAPVRVAIPGDAPWIARVRYANPNLRLPSLGWSHGAEDDPDHAALVARAEAAERHAAGRTSAVEMRRAEAEELEDAVPFEAFWAPNDRQARALGSPTAVPPLWVAARTGDGRPRWVPAAQVLLPFSDPRRPDHRPAATSSGVAAFTDRAGAAERGLLELIERDALMWHWVQRVVPRRLIEDPLPEPIRARLRAVRDAGWEPVLADLTLDTVPVVVCLLRAPGRLAIGLAAARTVDRAADKALGESLMIGGVGAAHPLEGLADPEAVHSPEDHLALHHHPDHAPSHEFLFAGDRVAPREIPAPAEPLSELLAPIGEPLYVAYDAPAVRPFQVVRALVPGLVPISFGWDHEPLGLPRLAAPVRTRDGRALGRQLDLREAGPVLPHPFP